MVANTDVLTHRPLVSSKWIPLGLKCIEDNLETVKFLRLDDPVAFPVLSISFRRLEEDEAVSDPSEERSLVLETIHVVLLVKMNLQHGRTESLHDQWLHFCLSLTESTECKVTFSRSELPKFIGQAYFLGTGRFLDH